MSRRVATFTKISAVWSRASGVGRLDYILPSVTTGLVTGIINLIVAISLSALIFGGELSSFVANGIGLFLLGGSVAVISTGFLSSASGTITVTQDAPAAILAVVAAAIVQSLGASATPEEKFMTVVAVVMLTTLLTGLTFILLGQFKLGGLVRFLPYPVVGGFLAGTGWLLVTGGISVMADVPFDLTQVAALFRAGLWQRWVPGLLLAVIMLIILTRSSQAWLLPSMFIGSTFLFYIIMWFAGKTMAQIGAEQWLVGPFPSGGLLRPLALTELSGVHWSVMFQQTTALPSILIVSVVSLLLNASGIELVIKRDVDLDRELQAAGLGTFLSGLLGGLVCYHALSSTTLNYRASNGSRLTSWITALLCMLPLFFGATLLSYLPKVILGSLLVLLGLSFLWEWVYLAWAKFPRVEYGIILLILGVSATVGYLPAIQVGLLAAVALFVINYSRVSVVRHALSGAEFQSRVTRTINDRQVLVERGAELFILQLQGFLFFGTAHNLLERVRSRIGQTNLPPLRFIVLDFDQVTGLDSTAVLSFLKMKQIAGEQDIRLLITAPTAELRRQLDQGGFIGQGQDGVVIFPDLDRGLEWCENKLLAVAGTREAAADTWQEQFGQLLAPSGNVDDLLRYLEPQQVETGGYLMRQRDVPDYAYFLTSGQLTARLEHADGASVRLETMRAGRVVGEIGFYLGKERTAAVVADEPSTVYRLSASTLERMERDAPEVAAAFHRMIARLLADRVSHLIVVVSSLQRKP